MVFKCICWMSLTKAYRGPTEGKFVLMLLLSSIKLSAKFVIISIVLLFRSENDSQKLFIPYSY